jgi:hypothetical protein
MSEDKTIYEFFVEHKCTKYEKKRLVVKLAELRYEKTIAMLKQILREKAKDAGYEP